ncbi:MAG TPA: UbiH/UbiF/VisC/COQ6 family ubiquinone biosynthesis hydroxylase [Caulobacteraceae bacterium]|nr:UbiH/UbiF/VisC/COQ6 family ubiquinone biosynthesis hydroxylase [Caulobacteraceae bacterium]
MSSILEADVAIVGAGPAGATLALALAQGGLKPVLIDRAPLAEQLEPTFDGRAWAIAYSAFRQWKALGLGARLEPYVQRIEQILVTDGRRPGAGSGAATPFLLRFDAEEIKDRSDGEPLGYMLENRAVRLVLGQALREAGVEVLAPARITAADFSGQAARLTLEDGRTVRAPLACAADGRGSFLRKAAGIGAIGWPYKQGGVVATVRLRRPHGGVAYEHFLPTGPFAILPLTEDRASLVWTESQAGAGALMAASPDAFQAHLDRRFGALLGGAEALPGRFNYPLGLELAERMCAPRVALLGDAAHGIHPIAGQGLNLGLKDAAALAEVLVDAARLGEDIGSLLVLERYAAWRRFDNVALAAGADAFVRLFSNDNPLIRLARGAGMSAVGAIGPARRFFMEEAGGAVGELPRLLRGEAL